MTVFGTNGSGGITNAGKISGASATGIELSGVTTFAGGIANSGTISAGPFNDGIFVHNGSLFSGGIVNNNGGRIAAGSSGIEVKLVTTFTGGISNSGKIASTFKSGKRSAMWPLSAQPVPAASPTAASSRREGQASIFPTVTTLSGGIVNRGTITATNGAGDDGISVTEVRIFGDPSTDGGITNSGTISAAGHAIALQSVTTFAGSIVNSGRLVAETGIHYDIFSVFGAGTSGGGITNTGTIIASDRGINLGHLRYFHRGRCQQQRDCGAWHRHQD